MVYAADENNGYSTMVLPGVNEAVRAGDAALVTRELADFATRVRAAAAAVDRAAAVLASRR